jgi:hypothetical protein
VPSEVTGISQVVARLEAYKRDVHERTHAAIKDETDAVLLNSQTTYVPVATGELRDDGKVVEVGDLECTISFGNTSSTAARALAIHETPSEHDPPSWAGKEVHFQRGGHKFLETPFRAAQDGMLQRIADKLKD